MSIQTTMVPLLVEILAAQEGTGADGRGGEEVLKMAGGEITGVEADFQAYVFWAYGFVCILLFLLTLYTIRQGRAAERRLEYLRERFENAFPEQRKGS